MTPRLALPLIAFTLALAACSSPAPSHGAATAAPNGPSTALGSTAVPATWVTFTSASLHLSFKYDPAWHLTTCPAKDSPAIVFTFNRCGQNEPSFGINSVASTSRPAPPVANGCDTSFPATPVTSVTVDGVTGQRSYGDLTKPPYNDCDQPVHARLAYVFWTNGRAYTVSYLYIPAQGANLTAKVDTMVSTFVFA